MEGARCTFLYRGEATEVHLVHQIFGLPQGIPDRSFRERANQAMRAALGEEMFASAWAEGQAMTLNEAIAQALQPNVRGFPAALHARRHRIPVAKSHCSDLRTFGRFQDELCADIATLRWRE